MVATPKEATMPVLDHLRREEANAVRLYLQYKGYHWNVGGPLFHDLHTLFDAHAKEVFEMIDALAERQRMLGGAADYTLEVLGAESTVIGDARLPGSPREMVERLLSSHRTAIRGLKEGIETAARSGDPGSADLLTGFLQAHEKMQWFLTELLEGQPMVLEGIAVPPRPAKPEPVPVPSGV